MFIYIYHQPCNNTKQVEIRRLHCNELFPINNLLSQTRTTGNIQVIKAALLPTICNHDPSYDGDSNNRLESFCVAIWVCIYFKMGWFCMSVCFIYIAVINSHSNSITCWVKGPTDSLFGLWEQPIICGCQWDRLLQPWEVTSDFPLSSIFALKNWQTIALLSLQKQSHLTLL